MNCNETLEYWGQSLRSGLSSLESMALAEHLRECGQCRQAFLWDSVIMTALLKDPELQPGRSFTAEICKHIAEKELKGGFSFMNSLKSSADIILTAFAGLILSVVYRADIMRLAQAFVRSSDEIGGQILRTSMKVFPNFDGVREVTFRSMGYLGQFPWVLIAGAASLIIVLFYLVDLFPDEGR